MKKTLTALTLAAVMAFGTTFANAGIIVAGLTDTDPNTGDPCVEKVDNGIIVAGFGIIVAGFTGIIVAGAADDTTPTNCGIIVAG